MTRRPFWAIWLVTFVIAALSAGCGGGKAAERRWVTDAGGVPAAISFEEDGAVVGWREISATRPWSASVEVPDDYWAEVVVARADAEWRLGPELLRLRGVLLGLYAEEGVLHLLWASPQGEAQSAEALPGWDIDVGVLRDGQLRDSWTVATTEKEPWGARAAYLGGVWYLMMDSGAADKLPKVVSLAEGAPPLAVPLKILVLGQQFLPVAASDGKLYTVRQATQGLSTVLEWLSLDVAEGNWSKPATLSQLTSGQGGSFAWTVAAAPFGQKGVFFAYVVMPRTGAPAR